MLQPPSSLYGGVISCDSPINAGPMTYPLRASIDALNSWIARARMSAAIRRFEAAWQAGPPSITEFLPAEEPARSAVGRAAATAAARWAVATGRVHLGWATVDGVPAARSAFGDYLSAAGFSGLGAGFRLVSSAPDAPDDDLGEAVPPLRRGG